MLIHNHSYPEIFQKMFTRRLFQRAFAVGAAFFLAFVLFHASAEASDKTQSPTPSVPVLTQQQFQDLLTNREVKIRAYYLYYQSLQELTQSSTMVVVGQVDDNGTTTIEYQSNPQPGPMTSPISGPLPGGKTQQTDQYTPTPSPYGPISKPNSDVPITTFKISITQSLRGSLKIGSNILVNQLGGLIELPTYPGGPMMQRTFVLEDNALMKKGDKVILFLQANPDGTYQILGGPQGRMEIKNGQLHSSAPDIPVLHDHQNETEDTLATEIQAIP